MPNWWPANIIVEGVRPWLWVPRQHPIRLIDLHATRGGSPNKSTEFRGTINWVKSDGNTNRDKYGHPLYQWGGCENALIAGDGQLAIILPDDHQPTWSAGYGWVGTWAVATYSKSYELAQPHEDDPFTDAQYERLAHECAKDHIAYGITPVMLPFLEQTGPVPSGITRHDTCANGRAYGKSDPGRLFDEPRFIGLLKERIAELKEEDIVAKRQPREFLQLRVDTAHQFDLARQVMRDVEMVMRDTSEEDYARQEEPYIKNLEGVLMRLLANVCGWRLKHDYEVKDRE